MRGIKYSAREKLKALKLWRQDHKDILWVAKKMKCTERSLWRWLAKYDGNLESLENASSRPHTKHPNAHTEIEKQEIEDLFKSNPDISYTEAFSELRIKFAYKRTYYGFWRYVVKNNLRPKIIEEHNPYIPQPYDTPVMFGHKWQMDVKYVPWECNVGQTKYRYYQYTMIDEATRERFLFAYPGKTIKETLDFTKRAIVYFGYIPLKIQTDNGGEFTNTIENFKEKNLGIKIKNKHPLDQLLDKLGVEHQLIRAYTPRHNGKVERSHRTDNEFFYKHLKFTTLQELREKMKEWNIRYNNKAHSSLRNRYGKKVWQTPLEKRAELIEQYKAQELGNIQIPKKFTKYDKSLAYAY